MSISKEQLLANRNYAQESTGPEGGPATVRATGNRLKQGLLVKEVVIIRAHRTCPRLVGYTV